MIVLTAVVRIDKNEAARWLPTSLMRIAEDTAIVFMAFYPDSYCCGGVVHTFDLSFD